MLIYLQLIDDFKGRTKFEIIYYTYRKLMYHVASFYLSKPQDVEDAVHDAFVCIAQNIEKIRVPVCPETKAYVSMIVQRRAVDLHRKNQIHAMESLDALGALGREYHGENRLTECLAQLPKQERDWIVLRYYYGYTTKETAKLMKITVSAAYKLDGRAKEQLRKICEAEGVL